MGAPIKTPGPTSSGWQSLLRGWQLLLLVVIVETLLLFAYQRVGLILILLSMPVWGIVAVIYLGWSATSGSLWRALAVAVSAGVLIGGAMGAFTGIALIRDNLFIDDASLWEQVHHVGVFSLVGMAAGLVASAVCGLVAVLLYYLVRLARSLLGPPARNKPMVGVSMPREAMDPFFVPY